MKIKIRAFQTRVKMELNAYLKELLTCVLVLMVIQAKSKHLIYIDKFKHTLYINQQ